MRASTEVGSVYPEFQEGVSKGQEASQVTWDGDGFLFSDLLESSKLPLLL